MGEVISKIINDSIANLISINEFFVNLLMSRIVTELNINTILGSVLIIFSISEFAKNINKYYELKDLWSKGNTYLKSSQYDMAIENYGKAIEILEEAAGDNRGEQWNLIRNIGIAYEKLGQYDKAIGNYEKALQITKEIGDRNGERLLIQKLAMLYENLGQYDNSIENYEKALEISKELGDRSKEGALIGNLGNIYDNLGPRYDKAIGNYEKALEISKELGDRNI